MSLDSVKLSTVRPFLVKSMTFDFSRNPTFFNNVSDKKIKKYFVQLSALPMIHGTIQDFGSVVLGIGNKIRLKSSHGITTRFMPPSIILYQSCPFYSFWKWENRSAWRKTRISEASATFFLLECKNLKIT